MAKIITIRPRGRDGDGVQERAAGVYKSHQLQIPADYLRTHPKVDRFQPAQWTQEDWTAAISHTLDSLHVDTNQKGEMLNDPAKRNIAKLVQSFYGGMQQVSSSAESKSGGVINSPTIYIANQEWMDNQGVGKGINHLYRPTDPAGPTVTLSAEYIVDLAKNQLGVITDRSMAGKNKVAVTSTRASNRG